MTHTTFKIIFAMLLCGSCFAQTSVNGGRVFLGDVDSSGALSTKPFKVVTADPAGACSPNNVEVLSSASRHHFLCNAGTWLDEGAGGGGGGTGTVTNTPGALTTGSPVIGNGGVDVGVGTKQGNTTKFATYAGSAPATNDCAKFDASGNLTTAGAACGAGGSGGSGTVTNTGGALTAGLPVIGAGGSDTAVGTKQGNTTKFPTYAGAAPTTNDCAKFDASGNITSSGAACGSASPSNLYDGMLLVSPAGSSIETGWRSPVSLTISALWAPPTATPTASSVMVFAPAANRTGNDPGATASVSDSTLMPISGAGAKLATIDTGILDGCAQVASGRVTSTGTACSAGGGGGGGTGVSFDTAGQGYFYALTGLAPTGFGVANAYFSANTIRADQLVLPTGYTFRHIAFYNGTGVGSACTGGACGLKFAIYNAACTTKLGETDVQTNAALSGPNGLAFTAPLVLSAGVYWILSGSDSTAVTIGGSDENGTYGPGFRNTNVVRSGYAANAMTGNGSSIAFPATCGAITAVNSLTLPVYFLEP